MSGAVAVPVRTLRPLIGPDAGLAVLLLLALAAAPPLLRMAGHPFWPDVLNRIMVTGIAATSLSLLISTAGLISFGHAVFLGLGAYAVGIASDRGVDNGFAQLALAVGGSAAFALLSGLVILRTRGVHFIMITMAFAQMAYFLMVGLKDFGGDDGLSINTRSQFPLLDLDDRSTLYYVTLACLAVTLLLVGRLRASRFGLVLLAAKGSERRAAASGFDPYRYRLAAYVIAGSMCGLAGFLNANFSDFVTPNVMGWQNSGELMFMVILGGASALAGPLVGAGAFLLIEEVLGSFTIYWHFWFGLFLIGVVLFARGGLVGLLIRTRR